jgi:hypothetical protein
MITPQEKLAPLTGRAAETALHQLIVDECVDDRVLDYVLPSGRPHAWEGPLWDYKRDFPRTTGRGSDEEKAASQEAIAALIKDVVAFHNSYGGYLIGGIDQYGEQPLRGCKNITDNGFTVEKLNEQLRFYTRAIISCRFKKIEQFKGVGLLLVPMRKALAPVAYMAHGAPRDTNGQSVFEKGVIYARVGDRSLPVDESSQGIQFLCSSRQFGLDAQQGQPLENNLPAQDSDLIEFVGRTKYLLRLWSWLIERNAPVKVLTALGGTGKTVVAHEFCSRVITDPPPWMKKLIWLTGKTEVFSQILGKFVSVTRTDFRSVDDFLAALAGQLGSLDHEVSGADRDELIDLVLASLDAFPSLVVVDDVDSLALADQADLFSTVQMVAGRAFAKGSRFLLTSRLDLGAGERQLIRLGGFEKSEFARYARLVAGDRMPLTEGVIDLLFKASLGSPLFCASIFKLVALGVDIGTALKRWKGCEGEEVREFAFKRELAQLTESQKQTLFALSLLGETTQLELQQVLNVGETRTTSDLAKLREFHLFTSRGDPSTGARLDVPEPIRLMNRVLRKQLPNPMRIEKACARARKQVPKVQDKVQSIVAGILALWNAGEFDSALLNAKEARKQNPKSGDINYFLGKSHLMVRPSQPVFADKAFTEAFSLGCSRPELISNWIEARVASRNFSGIVAIAANVAPTRIRGKSAKLLIEAMIQVSRESFANKDLLRAKDQMREAMREANRIIHQDRAGEALSQIIDLRRAAAENYLEVAKQVYSPAAERIDLFNASVDAINCEVMETWIIDLALESIRAYAHEVKGRKALDAGGLNILENRIAGLARIRDDLRDSRFGGDRLLARTDDVLEELKGIIVELRGSSQTRGGEGRA